MQTQELKALKVAACTLRMDILTQVHAAKSGHPGGSLSCADVMTYLYQKEMRVDPAQPRWEDRDRFVLSKGHSCPALYGALARRGFFDPELLKTFRHVGSILQGHPDMKKIPGVDMSSGSLGQGISAACGMAKAGKMDGNDFRVYTILGDGEMEEGQVWEAAMFAAHHELDNLCVIADLNGLQIDGPVAEVAGMVEPKAKFEGFGFHVIELDGHDFEAIEKAFEEAKTVKGKPTALLINTVKGKGVSFMENKVNWHGSAPNDEQYEKGMEELKAAMAELEGM
ncbi:MAG: transketolase [Clostridia bacterium]|nr:transketolase [Clostridia bacterium]